MPRRIVAALVLGVLAVAPLAGQPQHSSLRFPISASDSGAIIRFFKLYMGLHPQATVCLDTATFSGFEFCGAADTAHVTEVEAPPDPPSAVFRFSPYRSTVCNINFWKDDVRKFTDTTQSDTFRVLLKTEPDLVDTHAVTYSWPICIASAADSMFLQQRITSPPGAYRIDMKQQGSFTYRVSTGGINSQISVSSYIIIKGPRPNLVVAADDRFSPLPAEFGLDQNYPNPFNPATRIDYRVARAGHVTIAVFTLLGQPVATLVDGEASPGEHSVTWEASGFPSGIYFCRLSTPGGVFVRKLLLAR